jgi:hypothetical protein
LYCTVRNRDIACPLPRLIWRSQLKNTKQEEDLFYSSIQRYFAFEIFVHSARIESCNALLGFFTLRLKINLKGSALLEIKKPLH